MMWVQATSPSASPDTATNPTTTTTTTTPPSATTADASCCENASSTGATSSSTGGGVDDQQQKQQQVAASDEKPVNHDSCDCCGGGGQLVCCDKCPSSYHIECVLPPTTFDELHEWWYCRACLPSVTNAHAHAHANDNANATATRNYSLGDILTNKMKTMNPTIYTLPKIVSQDAGAQHNLRKRQQVKETICKYCEASGGLQARCNLCNRFYHLRCLDPPLSYVPDYFECDRHYRDGLPESAFSRRPDPYDYVSNGAVKIDFNGDSIPVPMTQDGKVWECKRPRIGDVSQAEKQPILNDTINVSLPLQSDVILSTRSATAMAPLFAQFFAWQKLETVNAEMNALRARASSDTHGGSSESGATKTPAADLRSEVMNKHIQTMAPKRIVEIPATYLAQMGRARPASTENTTSSRAKSKRQTRYRKENDEFMQNIIASEVAQDKKAQVKGSRRKKTRAAPTPVSQAPPIPAYTHAPPPPAASPPIQEQEAPPEPLVIKILTPAENERYCYLASEDNQVLFRIHKSPVVIGRSGKGADPDFNLGQHTVSRSISHAHAWITFSTPNTQFRIKNSGRNGTLLHRRGPAGTTDTYALTDPHNGAEMDLLPGDVLEIGHFRFYFIQPYNYTPPTVSTG
ncbi:Essential subunit of the histone deacetylase Rpd3S complex [Pelomyxa schiedti]|nr:Essential subunit of the histone deacetylase Rpd3S complex [Pelomyxa schiedti]